MLWKESWFLALLTASTTHPGMGWGGGSLTKASTPRGRGGRSSESMHQQVCFADPRGRAGRGKGKFFPTSGEVYSLQIMVGSSSGL